jgi:hypothetical protein
VVDRLWVMWRDPQQTRRAIGQLWRDADAFQFAYEAELPEGFHLLPEFPERRTYVSRYLFPTFAERIPSPRRPDYQAILEGWGVEHADDVFEVLARSGGILATDMIELCEWRRADDDLEEPLLVRVAGTRFHPGAESARPDDAVRLEREPTNTHDADATVIVLASSGEALGRVPRPYTSAVARLLDAGVPLVGTIARRLGVPNSYGRWVVELRRRDRAA